MSRINNLINSFEPNRKITEETMENSKLARDFLIKYKMTDKTEQVFLINSFWSLGWPDPYPNDEDLLIGSADDVPRDFRLPLKPSDDVYAPSRYIQQSPYCIYIPKKEVMLKIMRACVAVKDPADLWINRPPTN